MLSSVRKSFPHPKELVCSSLNYCGFCPDNSWLVPLTLRNITHWMKSGTSDSRIISNWMNYGTSDTRNITNWTNSETMNRNVNYSIDISQWISPWTCSTKSILYILNFARLLVSVFLEMYHRCPIYSK